MTKTVRLQILNDRIDRIATSLKKAKDEAFLRLVYSLLFNVTYSDIEFEDVVEGSGDSGLDIIKIEDDEDAGEATVTFVQAKNRTGFSSNAVIKLGNALDWVFAQPTKKVSTLPNIKLVSKIAEIRDLRNRLGSSNLHLRICFVTKGSTANISPEFRNEREKLIRKYEAACGSVEFETWGAEELIERINILERRAKQIDADLKIVYDTNRPTLIQHLGSNPKGVVCTVPGSEIAKIVGKDGSNSAIFDRDIRRYLGRKKVNDSIMASATDPAQSAFFWFYNNGITMVCDDLDVVGDPDNPHLKLTNVQIVNGCQTAVTLRKASDDMKLQQNVYVLVRVYETKDPKFVDRVTVTTNNQNVIRARDLRANDVYQEDLQRAFRERYGYYYERKVNEFKDLPAIDRSKVINNEKLGQAYLAVVMRLLTVARAQKYKVFGEYYEAIFRTPSIEKHMLAHLIYSYCESQKAKMAKKYKSDALGYSVVTNGVFHVARIVGHLLFGKDAWDDIKLPEKITEIQNNPSYLAASYAKGVGILREILRKNRSKYTSPNNFFKTDEIARLIDERLGLKPT